MTDRLSASSPLFAVVPAAGVGARMGAGLPKQYLTLQGRTLAEHTLGRLLSFAPIQAVVVAVADADPWWPELAVARHPRVATVTGGDSRARSVLAGVAAVLERAPHARVLVHDMARPLVRLSDIQALIDHPDQGDGAILARPVTDTIKQADTDARIRATLDRATIWRALTPQLFDAQRLHDALLGALRADPAAITDEASALEAAGARPALVAGHTDNIKVTVPEDLALARFYLRAQEEEGLAWQFV